MRSERTVKVPRLNDEVQDFNWLFNLWNDLNQNPNNIKLNFVDCDFLRPNAVAFLGGLIRLTQYQGYKVNIQWNTLQQAVHMNLKQNGFIQTFKDSYQKPWKGNSVPYKQFGTFNSSTVSEYLRDQWLGRGWMNVSDKLKNSIVGSMHEIFVNAFEHSHSEIGVVSCGQRFPKRDELNLTIVDFGIGIPTNVTNFLQKGIDAIHALEWAFKRGNSSRSGDGQSRGLGLDLLREFVQLNQGQLKVFTHDTYAEIDSNGIRFQQNDSFFRGTVFHIQLICDESYYQFDNEHSDYSSSDSWF